MKKTSLKSIAVLSVIVMSVFLAVSCGGKKDAKKSEKVVAEQSEENGKGAEPEVEIKIVKTKDPNPSSDFIYETTVEGDGVVIQRYIGSRGNVIIPEEIEGFKVLQIGVSAFNGIKNVSSVILPSSVEIIQANAFRESSIKAVTLNEGLIVIASSAFRDSKISEIVIPNSVEKFVGGYQFNNTPLSKITLSSKITSIPEGCFLRTSLSEIELPEGIASIGGIAFAESKLSKVNIPSAVKSIGNGAFSENPLSEVIFGPRANPITYGWNTFANCNYKGTMTVALRREINKSGYRGSYYETDVSYCREPKK